MIKTYRKPYLQLFHWKATEKSQWITPSYIYSKKKKKAETDIEGTTPIRTILEKYNHFLFICIAKVIVVQRMKLGELIQTFWRMETDICVKIYSHTILVQEVLHFVSIYCWEVKTVLTFHDHSGDPGKENVCSTA